MKLHEATKKSGKTTLQQDREEQEKLASLVELREVKKKYKQSLVQLRLDDRFIELVEKHLKAYPPVSSPKRAPSPKHNKLAESAVLVLSDSHIGKKVHKTQTLGFGNYNFQVFGERLHYVEDRVCSILGEHVTPKVDELIILMLGDMLDGSLTHGKEVVGAMTLFDQFYAGAQYLAQAIRGMASQVPVVRIYTAVGNHPRMGNQKKMPAEQRYSNFDHFLYAMVKEMLRNQTNVHFNLDYQPFCYFDVKGTKIMGMHGDHLRGGDSQLGIPIHAIARTVSGLTQLYESRGQQAPHLWVSGHIHRSVQLPTVKGEWLINGAFPGDDNFALTLSSSSEPMQLFFGIHPKYRKTWEYEIKLTHAPIHGDLPYALSEELKEMIVV